MLDTKAVKLIIAQGTICQHQQELLELASRHPDATRKGLHEAYEIVLNRRKDGLAANLYGGAKETFSYAKCTMGMRARKGREVLKVKEAMRIEVKDQTDEFRKENGFVGDKRWHVGHVGALEFNAIAELFLKREGLAWESIELQKDCVVKSDTFKNYVFKCKDLRKKWKEFHRSTATLEMQTAQDNLRRKKQKL